jgi:hypothetical protein
MEPNRFVILSGENRCNLLYLLGFISNFGHFGNRLEMGWLSAFAGVIST